MCDRSAPLALSPQRRDSLRPIDDRMMPDAQWAALARENPGGFAGAYLEDVPSDARGLPVRPQRVIVRLTRPTESTQALPRIMPHLSSSLGGLYIDTAHVLVMPARWDFAQLDEWRRYLDDRLSTPGLQSADTDEARNIIRYGVTSAKARVGLLRRLGELGVPCGLVVVQIESFAVPG